jgi:hypothetical protein
LQCERSSCVRPSHAMPSHAMRCDALHEARLRGRSAYWRGSESAPKFSSEPGPSERFRSPFSALPTAGGFCPQLRRWVPGAHRGARSMTLLRVQLPQTQAHTERAKCAIEHDHQRQALSSPLDASQACAIHRCSGHTLDCRVLVKTALGLHGCRCHRFGCTARGCKWSVNLR